MQEEENLRARIEKLTLENKRITQEKNDLVRENEELVRIKNLRASIEKLTLENKQITQETEELTLKNKRITQETEELTHENKRIIQEKKEVTLKNKQKDAENCIGWIIDKGLPPLGPGMLNSVTSVSQMKTVDYGLISEEMDVPALQGLNTNRIASAIWIHYSKRLWENEPAIRMRVETALNDCVAATGELRSRIQISPVILFPGIDAKKKDRTDIAVMKLDNVASLIGAVEVKKPPITSEGEEFDFDDVGQLVQYMYDLRASYGIRFIFGILTTYTKWRFLWLEDSHDAMMETSIEEFEKLCSKSPKLPTDHDAHIPENIVVKKSRIYSFDDKNLVNVLRSILFKWSLIPGDRVNGFLHKNRVYQTVKIGSKEIAFEPLPKSLLESKFSYKFPFQKGIGKSGTTKLHFLHVHQRSGDGKTALWTTTSGCLGVAKFLIPHDDIDEETMRTRAKQEADRWEELWNADAKAVCMMDQNVVLMPFAFHIREYREFLRFCPIESWNHRTPERHSIFNTDLVVEDEQLAKDEAFLKYQNDPLLAASEALHHMIMKCGMRQPDPEVAWRHVALMPTCDMNTITPIIIDLTRLEKVENDEKEAIFDRHMKILKDSMPCSAVDEIALNSVSMVSENETRHDTVWTLKDEKDLDCVNLKEQNEFITKIENELI